MASNCTSSNFSTNTTQTTSKTKHDILNEILTCGICLSRLSSPCCLPCAHAFCRSCLLGYAENNNINTSAPTNSISCPFCKFQLNFRSFEHFESMLVINPTLKQLCEALDASSLSSEQSQTPTNGPHRARCHACCLLKMLKVCKHCFFMLCETCRRAHLLDVHRESKQQLEILESRLDLINQKRLEMDQLSQEYDNIRRNINNYVDKLLYAIKEQRDRALQILDERQHLNDEAFWTQNGFDNGEKLDFFVSLLEIGQKKLSAKNITDKELIDLFDNLQTIPDIDEKVIKSMNFAQLSLKLDETIIEKQFIHVFDCDIPTKETNTSEEASSNSEQANCIES